VAQTVALRDWAKEVSELLLDRAQATTTEGIKPFPWEAFSKSLARVFGIEEIKVDISAVQWGDPKQFLSGIGRKPLVQALTFAPLPGTVHWMIPRGELRSLMGWLLTKQSSQIKFPDSEMEEAFADFLCLEALHCIDGLEYFKKVTPCLGNDETKLPSEAGLIMDLTVQVGEHKCKTRLVASADLHKGWAKFFAAKPGDVQLPEDLAQSITADVHLELAKTKVTLDEWQNIKVGDCLLLDECAWSPGQTRYPLTLSVKGKPLFHAELESGSLKILDFVQVEEL
jgi:hypothetical protein